MLPSKRCEVCGGQVNLIGEGPFGSCERCGLVYALRSKAPVEEVPGAEPGFQAQQEEREEEEGQPRGRSPSTTAGARWRCPDCDQLLTAENESDLKFVVREHVKELHPNRQ